jgi:hypothetical protein
VLDEVLDGEFWANTKVLGFRTTAADTTAADLKNLRREMDILSISLAGLVRWID